MFTNPTTMDDTAIKFWKLTRGEILNQTEVPFGMVVVGRVDGGDGGDVGGGGVDGGGRVDGGGDFFGNDGTSIKFEFVHVFGWARSMT